MRFKLELRDENSIIPETDLSFDSTDALEKQLHSLLCACFPNTPVKLKSCLILSGIIKPSSLIAYLANIFAMVSPIADGVGAMVTPKSCNISTFSAADSPEDEIIAPACPMRRPLGAVKPAI